MPKAMQRSSLNISQVLIVGLVVLFFSCSDDPEENVPSLEESISTHLEEAGYNGSVSITRGDQIIIEKGFGYADHDNGVLNEANTKFRIGSVTKPFTAMAILQLEEEIFEF